MRISTFSANVTALSKRQLLNSLSIVGSNRDGASTFTELEAIPIESQPPREKLVAIQSAGEGTAGSGRLP